MSGTNISPSIIKCLDYALRDLKTAFIAAFEVLMTDNVHNKRVDLAEGTSKQKKVIKSLSSVSKVCLFGFLTSSSTTRLYRGRAPRQSVWQFYVLPHMRQSWETMTSVSAGHIILTPTQPVGSGRLQRESNPGPPHHSKKLKRLLTFQVFYSKLDGFLGCGRALKMRRVLH